jgi:cell division protein FtsN
MSIKVRVPPQKPALLPPCPSVWPWLVVGVLIGMVLSFLVYLRELPSLNKLQRQIDQLTAAQVNQPEVAQNDAPAKKEDNKSIFTFYDEFTHAIGMNKNDKPPQTPAEIVPPPVEPPPVVDEPVANATLDNPDELDRGQHTPAIEPTEPQPTPLEMLQHITPPQGSVMLQVSSFRELQKANELKQQLLDNGFNTQIESTNIAGRDWYRVLVGPYQTANQITQASQQLEQQRFEVIIRRY